MSSIIYDCQKNKLIQKMDEDIYFVINAVVHQEINSILEMSDFDLNQLTISKNSLNKREEIVLQRKKFWEEEFTNNKSQATESVLLILKDKIKQMPFNFDYVNKLLIEESIH